MKTSELFALNEWLSSFPDNRTYAQIIDMLDADDWSHEELSVWETVEDCPLSQIAEFIENTRVHFERVTNFSVVNALRDMVALASENRPDDEFAVEFDLRLNSAVKTLKAWE